MRIRACCVAVALPQTRGLEPAIGWHNIRRAFVGVWSLQANEQTKQNETKSKELNKRPGKHHVLCNDVLKREFHEASKQASKQAGEQASNKQRKQQLHFKHSIASSLTPPSFEVWGD